MNHSRLAELPFQDPSPDADLVRRIIEGEKVLFVVLMRRYTQRLYRVVRAILRQDDEAEDVVQQACVTAYDKLVQFRGDASFGSWLTTIAVNEAFSRIRTKKRRGVHLELVESEREVSGGDQGRNPEDETLRREVRDLLEKQVDNLPDNLRVVFVMRDVEELSTAEAAQVLGISEEAVRVRLHRARSLIRDRLSAVMEVAPDVFRFAGERCDRIVLGVLDRLGF